MNKLLLTTALGAVPVAFAALPPAPFDPDREVACILPENCRVYAELPGFSELCAQGFEHPLVQTVLASPLGAAIGEEVGMPLPMALGMLNIYVGRPALPSLSKLTSEGLALGLIPRETGRPILCAVARGDAEEWRQVIELVMKKVAEARDLPEERIVPPHRRIRGMDVWLLGSYGALALGDGLFVASSDETTLRAMIDLGAAEGRSGLASRAAFQRAREQYRSEDAFLWGWADLDGLEAELPGELAQVRGLSHEPGAQFLLGPSIANLGEAAGEVFQLRFDGRRIDLDLFGLDLNEGPAQELLAEVESAPPPLPAPRPGEAARGIVYRDLATLFRERVDLFPPHTQPGFADAISNLALFFGGEDVSDEVLPGLDPWIGVISRPLDFDPKAKPDVPLPGAAFLVRMRDPEQMGPRLTAAVQSLLAAINIEAAQERSPVMTVSVELAGEIPITFGRYRTPDEGEGVDLRYNLEPACAVVGETFILGTHRSLVEEVALQLARGETVPTSGEHLLLSGPEIARVVETNEEALVLDAVVDEGKSEAQARRELRGLKALLDLIDTLELKTSRPAAHDLRASLTLLLGGRK